MRGAVVQKPKGTGRWYVVLDLDRDGTGRRRQKWHSGFRTKREAEKGLTALLARRPLVPSVDHRPRTSPAPAVARRDRTRPATSRHQQAQHRSTQKRRRMTSKPGIYRTLRT
jgi:Arm DNA-binding domain